MSAPTNQIVDIISHFIGELRIALEELRLRANPEEADATPPPLDELELSPAAEPPFAADEVGIGLVENGTYVPNDEPEEAEAAALETLNLPILRFPSILPETADYQLPDFALRIDAQSPLAAPPPPSLVAVVHQYNFLFDQDTVVVGNPDFDIPTPIYSGQKLSELETMAQDTAGGMASLPAVLSEEALADFATDTQKLIAETEVATASGNTLSGIWVNGTLAEDDAPDLNDHLPNSLSLSKIKEFDSERNPESKEGEAGGNAIAELVLDASQLDTNMSISSGNNFSVNEAKLVSGGAMATTIAVAKNHYDFDVIVQINALSSAVTIDPALSELFAATTSEDVVVNLANFATYTYDKAGAIAEANPDATPDNWTVTVVDSDLIFFNWLYQYSFTADGDTLVLTATGTTTTIGTGGNMSMNATGISYMGIHYDLLLVGGNLYDINYITQLNILYDDDILSVHGAMPNNNGTIETGGNVLWNEAQIVSIGADEWTQDMPKHYAQTMDRLDKGNLKMPKTLADDENFAGLSHLNVLYVKGDIYDINYIEQVNVVGDPDQVIFYAEEAFGKNVNWTVQTGGNVLVNAAAIIDYEGMGNTAYVGGEIYSEALLIQTEIIQTGGEKPFDVVTEVIAFIGDDTSDPNDMPDIPQVAASGYTSDLLESMLA